MAHILLIGPGPDAGAGGISTFVKLYRRYMATQHQISFVDTSWRIWSEPRTQSLIAGSMHRFAGQFWKLARLGAATPKPDVAHITCSFNPGIGYARERLFIKATQALGIPTVINVRGGSFLDSLDGLSHRALATRLQLLDSSKAVVVQTHTIAEWLNERLKRTQVVYVPNCIPNDEWDGISIPRREDGLALRVCFVGLVHECKGALDLLRATAAYRGQVPIHLSLFGRLAPGVDAQLRQLATGVSTPNRVEMLGEVPREELFERLRQSHVFAFPSYWPGEGQPNSMIEAMAAGLAIVCSPWRAIPELCPAPQHSVYVPPKNVTRIASALKLLADDEPARFEMGSKNKQRAMKQFGIHRMVTDLTDLYDVIAA